MGRKVGIIGSGHVGATIAHQIITSGLVDDLVLIDQKENKLIADVRDFREAMPNLPFRTNIIANDYEELVDADIVISAIGNIALEEMANGDRFAELDFNSKNAKLVGQKLKSVGFKGILVVITNPVDVITKIYQETTGFPKERVIGTGTLLDSARMRRAVGAKLNIDPRSISGYNLGEHGVSQFTAWSTVRVFDQPIAEVAKENQLDLKELSQEAFDSGESVYMGKKYTNFAIAAAAIRLMLAILNDAHTEMAVSNFNDQFGIYISSPAIIGKSGVIRQIPLTLTEQEKEKYEQSANFIKQHYQKTKK